MNAVNTIVVEDGQLVGHNTDSAGFILDLESHGIQVYGQHALVLGAGGAAHAAALGLANRGADVTVIARREQAAWDLRNHVRRRVSRTLKINASSLIALARLASTANLIVNCTPVGMWPRVEASIWPEEIEFPPDGVVYDMVYRPRHTALMKAAQTAGLTVIGGLGMLVQQGALAFELWTGQIAPLDIMREAAQTALSSSENHD
jgi:shikimate dehydrogenase